MSLNKLLFAGTALALIHASAPAFAQGVKDLRAVTAAPMDLMPAEDSEDASYHYDNETGNVPAMADISVTPAKNISLDTLGIYDAKSGGLDFNVWDGSDHARVKFLLEKLPETIPSPTVRNLVARLLLSATRPPQSQNIQQNVFKQRIETLIHIDEVPQAQRLVEMVPQELRSERTTHLEYTAHLLKGDVDWVCSNIGTALSQYSGEEGQWQKFSIFCLAREKNEAKAQLAIDLLGEQQVDMDAGFLALMDVMLGRSKDVATRFKAPLSLDDAALIALSGKDAFPKDYLKTAPLPIARLVKNNAEFADYLRDEAGSRLAAAIALEKPSKERVQMGNWFAKAFSQNPEKNFHFDSAWKDMVEKGGSAGEPRDSRRRFRFYTMLQSLGYSNIVASVAWDKATFRDTGRIHVSPIMRAEMATAVDKELTGESILLLAMAAGQVDDLADIDDASIADMVLALMQLGYTQEAQALAAEAMTSLY